jgi:hypothetical protein
LKGDEGSERRGQRLATVLTAAALLALAVGSALVIASRDSGGGAELPAECLRAWNVDPAARAFGAHDYSVGHDYRQAWVTRLKPDGLVESPNGYCAVIFPSPRLDREPFAAGQLLSRRHWITLTALRGVSVTGIAAVQAQAVPKANATLFADGTLAKP